MDSLSLIIGCAGFIFAIYSYHRTRKYKKISLSMRHHHIINESQCQLPELEVKFKGEPVERLIATKILIINTGNEVINRSDVSQAEPLSFSLAASTNGFLYDVLHQSKSANLIKLKPMPADKGKSIIDFDYLAPAEGGVLQVIHDGSSGMALSGTLKGGAVHLNDKPFRNSNLFKYKYYIVFIFMSLYASTLIRFHELNTYLPWDHPVWDYAWILQVPVFFFPIIQYLEFRSNRMREKFSIFEEPLDLSMDDRKDCALGS